VYYWQNHVSSFAKFGGVMGKVVGILCLWVQFGYYESLAHRIEYLKGVYFKEEIKFYDL
jgi:hypothetical protein